VMKLGKRGAVRIQFRAAGSQLRSGRETTYIPSDRGSNPLGLPSIPLTLKVGGGYKGAEPPWPRTPRVLNTRTLTKAK